MRNLILFGMALAACMEDLTPDLQLFFQGGASRVTVLCP